MRSGRRVEERAASLLDKNPADCDMMILTSEERIGRICFMETRGRC